MVIAERSHFDRKKKKKLTNIVNFNWLSSKYHVTKTKIVKNLLFQETREQKVIYRKAHYTGKLSCCRVRWFVDMTCKWWCCKWRKKRLFSNQFTNIKYRPNVKLIRNILSISPKSWGILNHKQVRWILFMLTFCLCLCLLFVVYVRKNFCC